MSDDLVELLREWPGECNCTLGAKSADRIEEQRKEVDGLIELLRQEKVKVKRLREAVATVRRQLLLALCNSDDD